MEHFDGKPRRLFPGCVPAAAICDSQDRAFGIDRNNRRGVFVRWVFRRAP
jgi:hypothetical protein